MPDDFDAEVANRFKVFDDVPVPDTWSRVQFKVLDRMPVEFTDEGATMIDLATPVPTDHRQQRPKRVLVAVLAAAAAVVAIAVVATRDDDATPADQPSPTVTVPPTVPPQALPNVSYGGPIAPGTYYVDEVDGTPTPRIFATIGTGWRDPCGQCEGWGIWKRVPHPDDGPFNENLQRDIGSMSFSHPDAVYSDACHWEAGNHPGPVDTVDGLVTALIEQKGWTDVTAPSDISIDGYVGKAFQRTALADMSDCTTRRYHTRTGGGLGPHPDFRSWEIRGEFNDQYEPGETETLWVIDLDGTMVVISTGALPEPSAGAPADFAADVLDSIRIERP